MYIHYILHMVCTLHHVSHTLLRVRILLILFYFAEYSHSRRDIKEYLRNKNNNINSL